MNVKQMKYGITFIMSCSLLASITAQTIHQEGIVRELNSKSKPVSGVFINFDDVRPVYKEALRFFKRGKITQAIQKLEEANPTERTREILAEENRLGEAQAELDHQKIELILEKKQQFAVIHLLVDLYVISFDFEKVAAQYDQLLSLDSTDLIILQESADFFREQHHYAKAINSYTKIIDHPEVGNEQQAIAYSFLGNLYSTTGSLPNALLAYEACFEAFFKLHNENPSSLYFKNSYMRLIQKTQNLRTIWRPLIQN